MTLICCFLLFVISCGMVYVDPEELKWMPYVKTWLSKFEDKISEETRDYLLGLFTKHVETGLRFVTKKCSQAMKQVSQSVRLFIMMLW